MRNVLDVLEQIIDVACRQPVQRRPQGQRLRLEAIRLGDFCESSFEPSIDLSPAEVDVKLGKEEPLCDSSPGRMDESESSESSLANAPLMAVDGRKCRHRESHDFTEDLWREIVHDLL